jgi:flagella basal body P-ring formation protein FlgA
MRAVLLALALAMPAAAVAETLVAARTLRPATVIGPGDIALIDEVHPGALSDPRAVIGLEARIALFAGRPIRPGDIGPAALVERNGIVTLVFRRGALAIAAEGRALDRGAVGDPVRVMNLASRTTITGVVAPDGRVHVVGSAAP